MIWLIYILSAALLAGIADIFIKSPKILRGGGVPGLGTRRNRSTPQIRGDVTWHQPARVLPDSY